MHDQGKDNVKQNNHDVFSRTYLQLVGKLFCFSYKAPIPELHELRVFSAKRT